MKLPSEAELLRVFVGESDKYEGRPLYEAIVEEARKRGMAGATVVRGVLGFGAHSRIHTAKILRLSEDLPLIVEIVDKPERIEAFLPDLDRMVGEGLITIEKVRVVAYRHGGKECSTGQDSTHFLKNDNGDKIMLIDTSTAGVRRGKLLWGVMPLPQNSQLLGTVRRGEDQGTEALILMPTGVTVGGNAGVVHALPIMLHCHRCSHSWIQRGLAPPRNCPDCNSPYWDRPRRK